jgi:nucleotide-binding universal stress UspA family protein
MARARPVLYATDFSPASSPAFRAAVDAARTRRTSLIIAHAVALPVPPLEDGLATGRSYDALLKSIEREATARLARLVRRARASGVPARALVLQGVPFEALTRAARRHRAQLVVLGTHGRTGFRRLMLGSVAARVIALAPCPVLTVRAGVSVRAPSA